MTDYSRQKNLACSMIEYLTSIIVKTGKGGKRPNAVIWATPESEYGALFVNQSRLTVLAPVEKED